MSKETFLAYCKCFKVFKLSGIFWHSLIVFRNIYLYFQQSFFAMKRSGYLQEVIFGILIYQWFASHLFIKTLRI